MALSRPQAILFDLDGTLADTAPDLAAAVNQLRIARGLQTTPYSELRPVASAGARGLIGVAFGLTPDDDNYPILRDEFLVNYETSIAIHSHLFDGVVELLEFLETNGIRWGIVTNKVAHLTDQLVPQIGLGHAACCISGDTTPHAKPHPAPLLEASKRIAITPQACWYVGDDLRDIQAGQAANMITVAAAWGYCGAAASSNWHADALATSPRHLQQLVTATLKS